ncbi:ERCC4 domain-containing protein [Prescottella subtropica]|uniref:ERCC4 domain-containing protein n=1 Tax=Prescottella subtropica TaxID=2545757 RepID=UPI0010FA089E|nr:histone-like nucleoid-structuring protein Lsr2 [Prescottella subtropica]
MDDLLIARNPEPGSTLPYLVRIPLGPNGIVVKAKQAWPRESKVYCHRADSWPDDAEILERHEVRSCARRGPAIDLVLTRGRENRSQLVFTRARGREMIFWQSPRTTKQARPAVALPTARAHGRVLEIVVDSGEKYAYRFGRQQATTVRRRLPAGDYAVEHDGSVVAAVERKSLEDLVSSLLSGKLTYAAAELSALPRAAIVVEDRYSRLFKLEHAPGARAAEALAELQARFPSVPVVFCETRPLAQEWTYRWLGACLAELEAASATARVEDTFAAGGPVPAAPPTPGAVREWARARGIEVSDRGRIPAAVMRAYLSENLQKIDGTDRDPAASK